MVRKHQKPRKTRRLKCASPGLKWGFNAALWLGLACYAAHGGDAVGQPKLIDVLRLPRPVLSLLPACTHSLDPRKSFDTSMYDPVSLLSNDSKDGFDHQVNARITAQQGIRRSFLIQWDRDSFLLMITAGRASRGTSAISNQLQSAELVD